MSAKIHSLDDFLLLLKGVKQGKDGQYATLCPGHDDRNRSLSVKQTDGKLLVKCFASCELRNILKPIGLTASDLFLNGNKEKSENINPRELVATFSYQDASGIELYQVRRYEPKAFDVWHKETGKYVPGLGGSTPVLYRLLQLEEWIAQGKIIYLPEGEGKVDRLVELGLAATTAPFGAKYEWLLAFTQSLAGAYVCILVDNDNPGKEFADVKAKNLLGVVSSVTVLLLPNLPDHGDIKDWLNNGHTKDELMQLVSQCPEYEPPADTTSHAPRGYIITDGKGKQNLDLEALVNDLLADFRFVTLRDNDNVLIYKDGYYQSQGKRFIKAECQRRVGVSLLLTEHKVNEIIGHITRSTYVDHEIFNTDKFTLNLINGLLDTRKRELRPHTPDYLSTIRIPVTYDANADCPAIRQFLSEVHHSQDIPVVEEIAGNCLTPDNSIQKAILIVGGGDQGKSTELSLLKTFIGADNCSNVPWHALELNRFALSALEGKLANIFADLPSQSLSMVSAFKMLTGGDTIGAERKFGDYYSFVNYAKLIFSANKPPRVQDEDSYAFWRRWIILDFPSQIPEDKKDVRILDKLTMSGELSGFLNIALNGLDRLRAAGRFSYNKSVEATTEYYLRAADPVYAFLQSNVEVSPNDWVSKNDLYDAFHEYCVTQCLPVTKPNSFARSLQNQSAYRISSTRPEMDGKRVTAWQGIKLSVKDVNVISLPKRRAKEEKIQVNKRVGKSTGNLDMVDADVQNSLKPDGENPNDEYPARPCPVCASSDFWLTDWNTWLCTHCHPKPESGEQC